MEDVTVLLKPFMITQKLLEGESYVTISLIPNMLFAVWLLIHTSMCPYVYRIEYMKITIQYTYPRK
jgi:hypothetical protein